ncbi:MAG TPA: hypothetical protein VN844_10955 [Pyrinomonadaceae bacterium]|nr:hypothetical protein [Pyrinomonadaceae bacterium]
MPDCITLKEIEEAVLALDGSEIRTLDDLRRCIARDVNQSTQWLSKETKVKHSLLIALLIAEFNDDRGHTGKPKLRYYWRGFKTFRSVAKTSPRRLSVLALQLWLRQRRLMYNWRRHWVDVLVIAILPFLLFALALRARAINNREVRYVTVQQGVPAFQTLTGNLTLKNEPYVKNAFTSVDEVVGRYALVNLAPGATVVGDQLLSSELSAKMQGRRILAVPVKAGAYVSPTKAPHEAIMVFSPRTDKINELVGVSFPVIVLRIDKTGDVMSAIVAIRAEDFDKASALLASHDVFLGKSS